MMKPVRPVFSEIWNAWGIECEDGMINRTCFSCLYNRYNIEQAQLSTNVDNYKVYSRNYPLRIQFASKEDTTIVCDFINKYIVFKALSGD